MRFVELEGVWIYVPGSQILPFPAEFPINGEHTRTGLSYPGKRPKSGVRVRTRIRVSLQIYAIFQG